jgi:hypothetical protein
MVDERDSEFAGDLEMAKVLVNIARAQPAKSAALAQAFVHAGIQVCSDEIGEAETAAWLRHLASLIDEHSGRKSNKPN